MRESCITEMSAHAATASRERRAAVTRHHELPIAMVQQDDPVKALFARSRNRCAFPDCLAPVVEDTGTVTAEICHIRALSPHGPRYDRTQTAEELNAAANLVLMCGRHHKIIDGETRKYTCAALLAIKRDHEEQGIAEISREGARVAQQLLANYVHISVVGNRGDVAIQSPGAVQARSITIQNTRTKLSIEAPPGSIGAARAKVAYCQHLIDRYQDYQKADRTGIRLQVRGNPRRAQEELWRPMEAVGRGTVRRDRRVPPRPHRRHHPRKEEPSEGSSKLQFLRRLAA